MLFPLDVSAIYRLPNQFLNPMSGKEDKNYILFLEATCFVRTIVPPTLEVFEGGISTDNDSHSTHIYL